jgi:PAS domain S-box-containing protein
MPDRFQEDPQRLDAAAREGDELLQALRESEAWFRAISDASPLGIFVTDPQGDCLYTNKVYQAISGLSPDEALGRGWSRAIHPDDRERVFTTWYAFAQNPTEFDSEHRFVHRDGNVVLTRVRAAPIISGGTLAGYVGVVEDITERRRAEQEREQILSREQEAKRQAEAAERRAKFLAEASAVLASSLDYKTTLSQVASLAVPDLADWCSVDMLGEHGEVVRLAIAHKDSAKVEWARRLQERYPPDPADPHGVPNVLRTGQSELYSDISDDMLVGYATDEEHLRIMRELGFTSVMTVPLIAHGRVLGAITFVAAESRVRYGEADLRFAEDLAGRAAMAIENARLYTQVQDARASAEEASRLKDEFLANVSHELRTPLNAILGWATMLTNRPFDQESAAHALEVIGRNARAQAQIIEDLLDVSRIITGKLRLDVRPLDPASFIEAAIESVRPAAEAKGVRLQKVLDTGVNSVSGDPARLQQVVWNLLSNAIKFTPRGGRVQVRLERVASQIEIAVSDSGEGISPEFLPYVFDRFRQAGSSSTRTHGGLGLGLAIVRHLVEMHGGTVRAASEGRGKGATFTVKLPLIPLHHREGAAERLQPRATDSPPVVTECPERLDGLRVLVVDDEPDTCEMLKVLLSRCGAEVVAVTSAAEALTEIERSRFDILVSDIGMPNVDGYELIRRVRGLGPQHGGSIPAIALTAYARPEDRLRALRAGYQTHVAKPVEPSELVVVIASLTSPAATDETSGP